MIESTYFVENRPVYCPPVAKWEVVEQCVMIKLLWAIVLSMHHIVPPFSHYCLAGPKYITVLKLTLCKK